MILSNARRLRFEKEEREKRKLTYLVIQKETGLAAATISAMLKPEPLDRISAHTISVLCRYFECGVGDLLQYVPDATGEEE